MPDVRGGAAVSRPCRVKIRRPRGETFRDPLVQAWRDATMLARAAADVEYAQRMLRLQSNAAMDDAELSAVHTVLDRQASRLADLARKAFAAVPESAPMSAVAWKRQAGQIRKRLAASCAGLACDEANALDGGR